MSIPQEHPQPTAAHDVRFLSPTDPRLRITGPLCGSVDVREIESVHRMSDGAIVYFDSGFVALKNIDPEELRCMVQERREQITRQPSPVAIESSNEVAASAPPPLAEETFPGVGRRVEATSSIDENFAETQRAALRALGAIPDDDDVDGGHL